MLFLSLLFITSTYCLFIGNFNAAYLGYAVLSFSLGIGLLLRFQYIKKITGIKKNESFSFADNIYSFTPLDILHLLKSKRNEYSLKNRYDQRINFVDFLYSECVRPKIKDINDTHFFLVKSGVLLPVRYSGTDHNTNLIESQVQQAFFEQYSEVFTKAKYVQAYYLMNQTNLFPKYKIKGANLSKHKTIKSIQRESIIKQLNKIYKSTGFDKERFFRFVKNKNISFDSKNHIKLNAFNVNPNLSVEDNVNDIYDIKSLADDIGVFYCDIDEGSYSEKLRYVVEINLKDFLDTKEIQNGIREGFFEIEYNDKIKISLFVKKKSLAKIDIPENCEYAVSEINQKNKHINDYYLLRGSSLDDIHSILPNLKITLL